jgi:hypothetical protein
MLAAVKFVRQAHVSEGLQCFKAACQEVMPEAARNSVKWIFTDAPDSVSRSNDIFPALQGVAEDAIHFVFRVEECFGEKRTPLSIDLLLLQQKFRVPAAGDVYNGEPPQAGAEGEWIAEAMQQRIEPDRDLKAYSLEPYSSHQQYIDDVVDLTLKHAADMRRKNRKGNSVRQIMQNGASYKHFAYLLNGSRIQSTLTQQEQKMLAWGTTGNEALHAQLKRSQTSIIQQHRERVPQSMKAFCLGRLLAHNAAAYHPTVAQHPQSYLLCVAQGYMMSSFFEPFGEAQTAPVTSRAAMGAPIHSPDMDKMHQFHTVAEAQKERWQTHVAIKNAKAKTKPLWARKTDLKRTVFTKKKHPKPRRSSRTQLFDSVSLIL